MQDIFSQFVAAKAQGFSALSIVAVGLAAWVGRGAFFAWHEGFTKFRQHRITVSRELARSMDELKIDASMSLGLKEHVESAVFRQLVGVRVDRDKRRRAMALFTDAGEVVQFELLRRTWSYLEFSGSSAKVKPLDGWRRWYFVVANAGYLFCVLLAVLGFLVAVVTWPRDHALVTAAAAQSVGFLLIAWQLLQFIWAYRAAAVLHKIACAGATCRHSEADLKYPPGTAQQLSPSPQSGTPLPDGIAA